MSYLKKLPTPNVIDVVDFFCGCGGMSWGFANTRQSHLAYRVLAGIDIDAHALETYSRNIEAPAINFDIRHLAGDPMLLCDLIPGFDPESTRPLVFVGCPPCQGFSAHRKKDPRDDVRNDLLSAFATICAAFLPDYVVIENVPEMLRGRYEHYFAAAEEIFVGAGYQLSKDVVDLSLFGVPQRRRRSLVIGATGGRIGLPAPIFNAAEALTVRDAISHLRPVTAGQSDADDPWHRAPNHVPSVLDRIRRTPKDGGDRRSLSVDDQLACHANMDLRPTSGFTDVYGRLRWDRPSITITAKSSTPSCGRFLHPEQDRNITVREAAILQGFPQKFEFAGPFIHQYRQIGEAVPPLFSRFVAWHILAAIQPAVSTGPPFPKPNAQVIPARRLGVGIVDCFSGAGGIALGFEAAGYQTLQAFDLDPDAVDTFRQNVSTAVCCQDIRDAATVRVIDTATAGSPFILAGGPPCQGFSQQRRGSDADDRNNLVLAYAELVRQLDHKPIAVVLENVTYLDSPRGHQVLNEYLQRIEDLGFVPFRHDLNSAEYGVPQLRHRIVVVAVRADLAAGYSGPVPCGPNRWPTVGEALRGLPEPGTDALFSVLLRNHQSSAEGELNRTRIAHVDMGGGRLSIPEQLQLQCHLEYGGHLDVYGRLDWFSQARTITGGFDSFTRGEYAHPLRHRSITHREGARLQGFPDWFVFAGNRAAVRRQIGNAVPPPMARGIAMGITAAVSREVRAWATS